MALTIGANPIVASEIMSYLSTCNGTMPYSPFHWPGVTPQDVNNLVITFFGGF